MKKLLCLIGLHDWADSTQEGVEYCFRSFCQTRRCKGECDMQIAHQDNAKSLEVCTKCGKQVCYGVCV